MMSKAGWVGNLYQKFEAMCHEVDDIVGQEHIKNLEAQVQSVGDNVMKFCSNVKDLIPSSFGVPVKHEAQSVNKVKSNFDLEDADGKCHSFAKVKEFPLQMDVTDSSKNWPSCIQVSDDLHFEDKHGNPPSKEPSSLSSGLQLERSECFLINQDYDSHAEEEKESSGILELICPESPPDNYFTDQSSDSFTEEKQSSFDSDSFTINEEELLSNIAEFIFPDEDPCEITEMSTSSMPCNENHEPVDKVSIDVSHSACEHSLGFEFHLNIEETVQETVDDYSLGPDFLCKDEMINDSIHENSGGSEFHPKEDALCDSITPGSQACLKEEMVCDSVHKHTPASEFQMKEETVHDSVPKSCFDVSTDNVPYFLLASSVASSDSETSKVRLASSINYPLLDSSDHGETEFHCREGHTSDNMVAEIGSASTSSAASQSSESFSCFESPKGKAGDMDSYSVSSSNHLMFTDVPIISHSHDGGHILEHMELPVKSKLDGSCVFVKNDSNPTVLSAVEGSWLRKKKIRGPFSSRKKLEKEYKQLSIWYCDIDAEFDDVSREKLVSSSQTKHLPAQDLQESEWELV